MAAVDDPPKQEFAFQAEIKQLLQILAHSLYQGKEIALRELVSNASDALDKQRYAALTDPARRDDAPLEIVVEGKPDEGLLVIRDNGIGMTRDELVTNLGTIARSGSLEFLKNIPAEKKGDLSLIGQFGVGFYAAFMLADRVRVRARSGVEGSAGWEWESEGTGTFRVSPAEVEGRGTEVILHLKDDAKEFADEHRIKSVLRRYSGFVPHPIRVGPEVVNGQKPIWVEPKAQVTDEQHAQFYQHLTHHADETPLWHLHMAADSPIQFRAVLYCPPTNYEKLGFGRVEHGLSLCARRILVQSDCRELLPDYLRFLHGLVDSEDLPLNVSRETLQDDTLIRRIRTTLVKGVLDRLQKLSEEDPGAFADFHEQFGVIVREGVASDFANRERVAKLLRFPTSSGDGGLTSLDDYIKRAPEDQKRIYYLGGPDLASIKKSPNLEALRKRNLEVLYLTDPIDEFVMTALQVFDNRRLTSIDSDDLDLPGVEPEAESKPGETPDAEGLDRVLELFRSALGDRVAEVRASKRLTDSPCCLVNADGNMSVQMQRVLRMSNQSVPNLRRILEINPSSPLVRRLADLSANTEHDAFLRDCGLQLWANALMLEGTVQEPEAMVSRVQNLMEESARSKG